jgi:hypothetical protein
MAKRQHTPEQIATALDLYREHGPAEAARLIAGMGVTGISKRLIATWARRRGVVESRRLRAEERIEAAEQSNEQRRTELANDCMRNAARLVGDIYSPSKLVFPMPKGFVIEHPVEHPPAHEQAQLARAAAALIDKAELLMGRATGRLDVTTPQEAEANIVSIMDALRERAERRSA